MAMTWAECAPEGVAQIDCIIPIFSRLIQAAVAFSGVVLFVMLVVGGLNFLFSGGDQKKLEKAKGTLSAAILGFVILVSAYIIIWLIETFTGVKVTQFPTTLQFPNE